MASPNMRAQRARLDGLGPTVIVETPHPGTSRWSRRHFRTKEGRIVNTVAHPNWTDRFREGYRIARWNEARKRGTVE